LVRPKDFKPCAAEANDTAGLVVLWRSMHVVVRPNAWIK
jgi:hypothetical protein